MPSLFIRPMVDATSGLAGAAGNNTRLPMHMFGSQLAATSSSVIPGWNGRPSTTVGQRQSRKPVSSPLSCTRVSPPRVEHLLFVMRVCPHRRRPWRWPGLRGLPHTAKWLACAGLAPRHSVQRSAWHPYLCLHANARTPRTAPRRAGSKGASRCSCSPCYESCEPTRGRSWGSSQGENTYS